MSKLTVFHSLVAMTAVGALGASCLGAGDDCGLFRDCSANGAHEESDGGAGGEGGAGAGAGAAAGAGGHGATPIGPGTIFGCGDGTVVLDEECDDSNRTPGDGCSAECTVEPGWECADPEGSPYCWWSCGDGTLDEGEECDDENTMSNDGCSDACAKEGTSCESAIPVLVTAGATVSLDGTLAKAGEFDPPCTVAHRARVYAVDAGGSGTLTLTIKDAGFETSLYVRRDCAGMKFLLCASDSELSVEVDEGISYVFVSGASDQQDWGPYTLELSLKSEGM